MPRATCSLFVAALGLALAVAAAAAPIGDGVTLTLTGPATPYAEVRYAVAFRRGAVIAEVDKTFAAGFGKRGEVGLLARSDLTTLLDAVEELGAFTLPGHTRAEPRTIWRIETHRGQRHHAVTVHDPERLADGRYRALIDRVRDTVERTVGPVPHRDGMLLHSEYGLLRLRSTPAATLTVDGVPWPGTTPMSDVRLTAGDHTLALTPLSGGPAHTYDVRIEIGKTTSLVVELR